MTDPVAYACEVYNQRDDEWHNYSGKSHPDEVFDHIEVRNVTPLYPPLSERPPMQVLQTIQDLATDEDYAMNVSNVVTAATNIADVELIAHMANQREDGPILEVVDDA